MKKKYIFFLTFIISSICILRQSYAQKQTNIWYFGDHAGLTFNSGAPVPLLNGQTNLTSQPPFHAEGVSVLSDSTGNLLCYSNGMTIWNRNHQVMPNGDSILGHNSSTQAALIIPQPGNDRYLYVFTTSDGFFQKLKEGFRYSVVDMCLDGGNGDVMAQKKNIFLLDTVCEKLTAVPHANGIDYWVIVHKYYSSDFCAYLLTPAGITSTVVSTTGLLHPLSTLPHITGYALGWMKSSPDGKKLALVSANGYGSAQYVDFDNATGIISNPVDIGLGNTYHYIGTAFSPDNSKLYISSNIGGNNIFQFDMKAGGGNPDSVKASRTPIAKPAGGYYAMVLATDGKIYVTGLNGTGIAPFSYLSAINSPNSKGLLCNYKDSAVYLGGKKASWDLPNFMHFSNYRNTTFTTPPQAPVNITPAKSAILCAPRVMSLTAVGTGTLQWYATPTSSAQLGAGRVFTVSLQNPGTYTYYVSASTCTTSERTAITVTLTNCVGIEEFQSGISVNVFPNPIVSSATISFNGFVPQKVEIYDLNGRCLQTWNPDADRVFISEYMFSPGFYFLKIYRENLVLYKRLSIIY